MPRTTLLPERFLHEVWAQQLFKTTHLETHEGHRITIIDPGKPNRDTGPDFLDARIRIGDTIYFGDVEIHRTLNEWSTHLHQHDPRYNTVILHVVMNPGGGESDARTESGRRVPTMILDRFLIEPVRTVWQRSITGERIRRLDHIACYGKNKHVDTTLKLNWIHTLGMRRIELKVRTMRNRLHELASPDNFDLREPAARYGEIPVRGNPDEVPPPVRPPSNDDLRRKDAWEQLLYESIAEALGYSKNQLPFRRLSALATFPRLCEIPATAREAFLFAMAGLLDVNETDTYREELLKTVETEKIKIKQQPMNATEWQFFRLRPHNFPTLRIAALAGISGRMIEKAVLEFLLKTVKFPGSSPQEKIRAIRKYFTVPAEGYWKNHYTFGKKASRNLSQLIGKSRIDEITINVVIPFLFLYARTYKDIHLRSLTEELFSSLPAPAENNITRKIDKELLTGTRRQPHAPDYQGKIQLYKFYCREERCSECDIGKIVFV
jgi:hypothetical protein